MRRFIHKKINDKISSRNRFVSQIRKHEPLIEKEEETVAEIELHAEVEVIEEEPQLIENKEENKEEMVMDTKEKIQMANALLNAEQPKVKKVKKEKGLIERTESSITILTEDNRELLKD